MKQNIFLIMALSLSMLALSAQSVATNASETIESSASLPKLLDLGAHKCLPCMKMAPILEELTLDYAGVFDVVFIDVWKAENKEKAKAYGVRMIPTQIFFDAEGKELWRHEGYLSKEDILEKWKALGFTFAAVRPEAAAGKVSCCGK